MAKRRKKAGDPGLAVAYLRVSTEEQHLGPEAQRSAIEAWASARGVRVVAWFEDRGVSGAAEVARCPGLMDAITEAGAVGAGVLVAAKRDRIARDVMKAAMVERLALREGARVVCADGVGEGDDPASVAFRQMLDVFAQFERAMIQTRTLAAMRVKRARGEFLGEAPIGTRRAGRALAEDGARRRCWDAYGSCVQRAPRCGRSRRR